MFVVVCCWLVVCTIMVFVFSVVRLVVVRCFMYCLFFLLFCFFVQLSIIFMVANEKKRIERKNIKENTSEKVNEQASEKGRESVSEDIRAKK